MDSYEQAWKSIVQPPRVPYTLNDELPVELNKENEKIVRSGIKIQTIDKNEIVYCHLYHSVDRKIRNILIYLHSFSGNAKEGTFLFN